MPSSYSKQAEYFLKNSSFVAWLLSGNSCLGVLTIFKLFFPETSEASEWAMYLLVGLAFPLVMILVKIFIGENKPFALLVISFTTFLACLIGNISLFALALVSSLILFYFKFTRVVLLPLVLFFCWYCVSKLYYWESANIPYWNSFPNYLVFSCCFGLAVNYVFNKHTEPIYWTGWFQAFAYLLLFYGAAFFGSYHASALHHLGCYTGPAELVKNGGWLLWSVPSQYGFLSILSIALLPFKSIWQSVYVLNTFLLFTTACLIFHTFLQGKKTILNILFALVGTYCALFLFTGWVITLESVYAYPSVGPLRFFWVYLLLFHIQRGYTLGYFAGKKYLVYGSFIWLIGVWWASESALYVSAIWLSHLVVLGLSEPASTIRDYLKNIFLLFRVPVLFFGASLAMICAWYLVKLGHLPELTAYTEHLFSFKNGFGSMLTDQNGGVAFILLVASLLVARLYILWKPGKNIPAHLAIPVSLFMACWIVSSYFIGRSHENNISNLVPIFLMIILCLFRYDIKIAPRQPSMAGMLLICLVPALAFFTLGNKVALANYFDSLKKGFRTSLADELPKLYPAIQQILYQNGYKDTDKMVYLAVHPMLPLNTTTQDTPFNIWLPANTATVLGPLDDTRIKTYFSRFSPQVPDRAWCILQKGIPEALRCHYVMVSLYGIPRTVYQDQTWLIQLYDKKDLLSSLTIPNEHQYLDSVQMILQKKLINPATVNRIADRLIGFSLEYYQSGNYLACIQSCRNSLLIRPQNAIAYNNIGSAYNMLGKNEEAAEACKEALRIQPDFELAKNNLMAAEQALSTKKKN